MRGIQLILASALVIAGQACFGQTATPTAEQIISKYVEAAGGKAAIDKLTNRVMEGKAELTMIPGSAPIEIRAKAPNKAWSKTDFPGVGAITEGCDGQSAWSKNALTGVAEKKGDELAKAIRDATFNETPMLLKTYPDLKVKGTKKLGEADVYVLESKPAKDSSEVFYFDTKSSLCVGHDSQLQSNGSAVSLQMVFDDFRVVDGVKMPHGIKIKMIAADKPEVSVTIKLESIKHNVPIDDAIFKKPAS